MEPTTIHTAVSEHYAELARSSSSCCGNNALYDVQLIQDLPADISGFSLGCGDPITLAQLRPGETVLDLGSGGGLDCFLAAKQVGEQGRVIGVDMTPEMLNKARANAERLKAPNVEFRAGYLEGLPVEDHSIDVIISNCVINLSPDKPQVFREMFRAVKPGGRVSVSDIVTNGTLPKAVQQSIDAWGACVAGALQAGDYVRGLREAGFVDVQVQAKSETDRALAALPIGVPFSAAITARKPLEREETTGAHAEPIEVDPYRAALAGSDELIGHLIDITPIENGYDLKFAGEPDKVHSLAAAFAQSAGCCTALRFDIANAGDGVHVRVTSDSATPIINVVDIN